MNYTSSQRRRRGSAYVLLLSGALVVVVAGVTAVRVTTANVQTQGGRKQGETAMLEAQAGLEYMVQRMANDPGGRYWRESARFSQSIASPTSDANTTLQIRMVDPADNDLSNDVSGDVECRVRATTGAFSRQIGATFRPTMQRMKCLELAVAAEAIVNSGGDVQVNGANMVQLGSRSATEPFFVDWSGLSAATGGDYSADQASDEMMDDYTDQRVPGPRLIGKWEALGTRISITSDQTIERVVFSPTSNPLGAANAQGIYVLDLQGHAVTLKNIRVYGTLIIITADASKLVFQDSITMEPASQDMPALLIQGGATFDQLASDLSEIANVKNFNPAGAPFQGATDSDVIDTYPSMIRGLVYVDGDVNVKRHLSIQGQLFASGTVTVLGQLYVQFQPIEGMPLGFSFPLDVKVVADSVKRH